jgi:molybdenum cofactor guanylyltransferase
MSTPRPLTGFVLAGGLSRRLGRDKASLPWPEPPRRFAAPFLRAEGSSGFTLLDNMVEILATACDPVFLVGRRTARGLPDHTVGLGPVGGISTALHRSRTDHNIIVAVDLPLLTSDFVKYFKERCQQSDRYVTACKIGSAFPLCVGIRTDFKDAVDHYIAAGHRSVHGLIEAGNPLVISLDELRRAGFSESIFTNINSESDYTAALKSINHEDA